MEQSPQVISVRPAEQEIGPSFQASVTTSPANVYLQEVTAQTADENRFSFQWRSPSSGLICSPLAYIRYRIKVKSTTGRLTKDQITGVMFGASDNERHDQATDGLSAPRTVHKLPMV